MHILKAQDSIPGTQGEQTSDYEEVVGPDFCAMVPRPHPSIPSTQEYFSENEEPIGPDFCAMMPLPKGDVSLADSGLNYVPEHDEVEGAATQVAQLSPSTPSARATSSTYADAEAQTTDIPKLRTAQLPPFAPAEAAPEVLAAQVGLAFPTLALESQEDLEQEAIIEDRVETPAAYGAAMTTVVGLEQTGIVAEVSADAKDTEACKPPTKKKARKARIAGRAPIRAPLPRAAKTLALPQGGPVPGGLCRSEAELHE
ncbi:uncharacterized protein BDZ99DRAFT_482723 [Mytilinidion resinicola]|uniref:Uncharacterized protein n=1 Tax=Mytilinidion resinicola TaxID=574789 RepID=A0A6A6Y468_9PEZI|nr:uncharacterized protein BDZ99DRAFT_482723 [Mytilinidion resinicola]KAF2802587.1 hypothetical protein BDZ99DRAFT_482723 [Mytilinidion resinicola]